MGFTMKSINQLFILVSIAMLSACGGGSDNEGGSDITPPTPPPPVVKKNVTAMDFRRSVTSPDVIGQPLTFNLSNYVTSTSGNKLSLSAIVPVGDLAACKVTSTDKQALAFLVTPNSSVSCDYRYTVTDGTEQTSGLASILFTSQSAKLMASEQGLELPDGGVLSDLSKSVAVGNTLSFNLQDELAPEFAPMTRPKFEASTVVVGSGTAHITEEGDFSYQGVEVGLTSVTYSVTDDNKLIFTGVINIDVSGDLNSAPITKDGSINRIVQIGDSLTLDILNFPGVGSLVTDKEGDKVQLVGVQVYGANVSLVNPMDVNNTQFTFSATKKAMFEVKYTVYDHEVDGVSTGVITIETGFVREGILEFSFNGFIKLFGDGALGAVGRNTLIKPFKNTLIPYMENNGLYATALKNIGFGNYRIDMSSEGGGEDKIILFSPENALQHTEVLIELPATSHVYYGLTYADRIQGFGGIVYEVTQAGKAIAHNQIYGTSNLCYSDFTQKFNALKLTNVESIESFGTFSAMVILKDETANYYGIDCKTKNIVVRDFSKTHRKAMAQCWSASPPGMAHGSFYCIKNSENQAISDAFWNQFSEYDDRPKNFYNTFVKFFNKNENIYVVKTTQVPTGIAALTDTGDLYVLFDGKDKNGDTYKMKKVATKVHDYQQAANYVTYMRGDVDEQEFGGYAQYHQETLPSGKKLNLTINFDKLDDDDREDVLFYENTANAIALVYKNKLKVLTNRGLKDYGGKDHYYNVIGDSANSYGTSTVTTGQGRSTFFARGNHGDHLKHWELISPLKEIDKSLGCDKPKHENVSYPYILSGCDFISFKMNGAILKPESSGVLVYPEERFADLDASGAVYPDLMDLDNDGFSTVQEEAECIAGPSKYQHGRIEYCSHPMLSDSDGDNVLDSLESLYQGNNKGNHYTRFSHIVGDYHKNEIGPYDGNKDINSNGQLDKYDN